MDPREHRTRRLDGATNVPTVQLTRQNRHLVQRTVPTVRPLGTDKLRTHAPHHALNRHLGAPGAAPQCGWNTGLLGYTPRPCTIELSMSPSREEVRCAVLQIARRELALSAEQVDQLEDDTDLGEHLDSIQRLSLVVGIDDHFQLCFEPEDDEDAVTLGDVITIVQARLEQP